MHPEKLQGEVYVEVRKANTISRHIHKDAVIIAAVQKRSMMKENKSLFKPWRKYKRRYSVVLRKYSEKDLLCFVEKYISPCAKIILFNKALKSVLFKNYNINTENCHATSETFTHIYFLELEFNGCPKTISIGSFIVSSERLSVESISDS